MTRRTNSRFARVYPAALVAAGLAGPAAAPAVASGDVHAAKRILAGTAWTTYTAGAVTGASQDRTAHLCGDGRFVVVTTFVASTYIDDPSSYDHPYGESRVTGRWRVSRARLSRNRRYGKILVRYTTDQGQRGSAVFAASPRGTYLGGSPAEVAKSSVC